jgi:uncharacterized membrane protein YccC
MCAVAGSGLGVCGNGIGPVAIARSAAGRLRSSRLAVPFRPASSGPVRYWQDRTRLAVKGAIAAVVAWALAKYAAGQPDPYFAPLAALLGVYPTVARSLRESIQYIAGFLLGAALAVPVGMLLGPGTAGIAVIVLAGLLIASWRRLGDQSAQVTFTALFALLLGGHQPLHYVTHRMSEVAIGLITGLVINIAVFPPLQLRPAEHAVRQWGNDIADALEVLADTMAARGRDGRLWPQHDEQLSTSAEQAHAAVRRARESLRWNPRASASRQVPGPDGAVLGTLEELTTRTRAVARSLPATTAEDTPFPIPASFGQEYARLLRMIADAVRQLADQRGQTPPGQELAALSHSQHHLEDQAARLANRRDGNATAQRLSRLTADMIHEIGAPGSAGQGRPTGDEHRHVAVFEASMADGDLPARGDPADRLRSW